MKQSFTIRGYSYILLDEINYGLKYFGLSAESMTDNYLSDCVRALGTDFIAIKEDDEITGFYCYVSPTSNEDSILSEVIDHLRKDLGLDIDQALLDEIESEQKQKEEIHSEDYANLFTAYCLTENLIDLKTRKNLIWMV